MPTKRAARSSSDAVATPNPTVDAGAPALNLAVVAGMCSGPPDVRTLPSGTSVANLSVTVAAVSGGVATSVPVAVFDPPTWVTGLEAGERVG